MATMAEKMAASLEELRKLQEKDRCVVLQGTAGDREDAFNPAVG